MLYEVITGRSETSLHDDAWGGEAKHRRRDQLHAGSIPQSIPDACRVFEIDTPQQRRVITSYSIHYTKLYEDLKVVGQGTLLDVSQ